MTLTQGQRLSEDSPQHPSCHLTGHPPPDPSAHLPAPDRLEVSKYSG
ncbi:MAG: hypothetical protein AB1611_14570 [bacterium]